MSPNTTTAVAAPPQISDQLPTVSLESTIAAEIKEYHLHLYFFQNNTKNCESAFAILKTFGKLIKQGYGTVVPQNVPGGNPFWSRWYLYDWQF